MIGKTVKRAPSIGDKRGEIISKSRWPQSDDRLAAHDGCAFAG